MIFGSLRYIIQLMKNKITFILLIFLVLGFGVFSVLQNTPMTYILTSSVTKLNAVQRVFGLWIFSLMFIQIVLGDFMIKLTEKFGGWIFRTHIIFGVSIYFMVLIHTLSYLVINYLSGKGLDPFYVFVDVCLVCDNKYELFLDLGRISFWLVTTTVVAGYFRTMNQFLRVHWRKFHLLNYVLFLLVAVHSYFLGTDITVSPFSYLYYPFAVTALVLAGIKGYSLLGTSKDIGK